MSDGRSAMGGRCFLREGSVMRTVFGFLRREDGLTTVEWVVLTAVVLLAALGISNMVLQGADDLGGAVADRMSQTADDITPPPAPAP